MQFKILRKDKKIKKINFFIILFLSFCIVKATPSTCIFIPSVDFQPFLNPHFGLDCYFNTYGVGNLTNAGITIGVLPFEKLQMEVGIDYRDINGIHDYPFLFNAKIGIPEDIFINYQPAFAFGIYDVGFKTNINSYNIGYGLLGKSFGKFGRISLGAYKGAIGVDPKYLFFVNSDTSSFNRKISDIGFLASYDRYFSELNNKLWICIDFLSGYNSYGSLNFGFAWFFTQTVSVILGYDIYLDNKVLKPTFNVQFDINMF
jgi:hypothetical protein